MVQTFIAVVPEEGRPDRAEFLRDAEAALRLGNPRTARLFLIRLCRQRAWKGGPLPPPRIIEELREG